MKKHKKMVKKFVKKFNKLPQEMQHEVARKLWGDVLVSLGVQ